MNTTSLQDNPKYSKMRRTAILWTLLLMTAVIINMQGIKKGEYDKVGYLCFTLLYCLASWYEYHRLRISRVKNSVDVLIFAIGWTTGAIVILSLVVLGWSLLDIVLMPATGWAAIASWREWMKWKR